MLFKIIGSIIVLLSTGFLGYILSTDCRKRPEQLRELQSFLNILENRISYLSDILTEAFDQTCSLSSSVVAIFFEQASEILKNNRNMNAAAAWEQSVKQNIGKTSLNREDEKILAAFGKMLGSSDLEGQIRNIRLTISHLAAQEEKAEQLRKKNEGMYRNLCILGGLAIVIVLL